jgi:hypothetical protein
MNLPSNRVEHDSRVEHHLRELAGEVRTPRELAAVVAGTSEETASLFDSGHTLAEDNTGPHPQD